MKKLALFAYVMILGSNALAAEIDCKGGFIKNGIEQFSTLERVEYEPTMLYATSNNETVGTFAFIVKQIGSSLDLVITSEDGNVTVRSISKTNETRLIANIGQGYFANISCSEK